MYANTVTEFRKMLINMDKIMAKAETYATTKKFDVNVLATLRLAPDMFPLNKQIQSACDAAKFCAAYLSEKTAPVHEDNETTWAELRERLKKVINYLESFKESDFKNVANVKVAPKWAGGSWLTGPEYFHELAVPNFFFHITTTYAILRQAGVDIGKTDYIGDLNFKK